MLTKNNFWRSILSGVDCSRVAVIIEINLAKIVSSDVFFVWYSISYQTLLDYDFFFVSAQERGGKRVSKHTSATRWPEKTHTHRKRVSREASK